MPRRRSNASGSGRAPVVAEATGYAEEAARIVETALAP